jgi:hypothetical protein
LHTQEKGIKFLAAKRKGWEFEVLMKVISHAWFTIDWNTID